MIHVVKIIRDESRKTAEELTNEFLSTCTPEQQRKVLKVTPFGPMTEGDSYSFCVEYLEGFVPRLKVKQ